MSGVGRREFLLSAAAAAAPAGECRLIAHRGGVVDEGRLENSAPAMAEAVRRGYWMIEVDVRRSRDGEPVLHHDPVLTRDYGEPRRVEEMTWKELRALRATPGGGSPVHFEEACALCQGKTRLMLDLKGRDWPREFYRRLRSLVDAARVPEPLYSLGGPAVRPLFDGRIMTSIHLPELTAAAEPGEAVASRYFCFELGADIDRALVAECARRSVTLVAAINTFRYTMAKRDEWLGPKEDIARLRRIGVRYYQIDSRYQPLFASA
jgi:glycerophosphoryl diester phosphodiesterase